MNINEYFQGKLLSSKIYPIFFKLSHSDIVINLGCGYSQQALVYKGQYKKMYGIDINENVINYSKKLIKKNQLNNYTITKGNVEKTEFQDNLFDKAIAIDVIEHVKNPVKFCNEVYRILTPNGKFLITFPALHDRYIAIFKFLKSSKIKPMFKDLLRLKKKNVIWYSASHNHDYSISKWLKIVDRCGFKLIKSRSTTMFPPLHFFGIKRFWFSNRIINSIDSSVCKIPIIKRLGQAFLCVFEKKKRYFL